ncbi:MAG: Na+/H+ antiporter [Pedosphaera sp.]|nr:Na+/H+ antiporter [Pedosphaera sp.]
MGLGLGPRGRAIRLVEVCISQQPNYIRGGMEHRIDLLLGLLVAVAALALLAQKIKVPYPILFVIGGLLIALIPGLPRIQLQPELVFFLFLPPLLFPSALFTSWRDFYASIRPISLLAVGLVLFTTLIVGYLAHYLVPGLPLAAAFALGAIISPPDAVAATAITQRLGVPRRVVTILEGESLVNDASALVALRFAIAAMVTGSFSLASAGLSFVIVGIGGIAIGLAIGWLSSWVQKYIDDPPIQITISLLTPFAAYVAAERLGVSGVLAVVTAGLFIGWRAPEITNARMRLQAYPVWEMIVFLLNGIVFILIGLQLPEVLKGLEGQSLPRLCWQAFVISVVVILIRILWVYPAAYLPRLLSKKIRERESDPTWRNLMVVAWTGMRGVVSLAAALALPFTLANGAPFPGRNLILFFTFSVILATLVFQGLTLPFLIRWLGVHGDGESQREEREARLRANQAALARLKELGEQDSIPEELIQRLRVEYEDRLRELEVCELSQSAEAHVSPSTPYKRLQQEALVVERNTILQLRNERVINDEVMRRIEHDLDLAEARLRLEPNASH